MLNRFCLLFISVGTAVGCAGAAPSTLGVQETGGLAACGDRPNCVSSRDERPEHQVAPLQLTGDLSAAWEQLRASVEELPGTVVVTSDDRYLHAESTSAVMRYVDDLELLLDPATGRVDVRSASRVGYSDMGVNAARVTSLRGLVTHADLPNSRP